MRRSFALVLSAVMVMAFAAPVLAGGGTGITATRASTIVFDGGNVSARFVRAASGIINETNRTAIVGTQNPWTSLDVWLQFRPLTGPQGTGFPIPNPACDPVGLVTSFAWSNGDPVIGGTPTAGYFINGNPYNVCVYLAPGQVVASGTIDSTDMNGTTVTLPLYSRYRIDVSGTWLNRPHGTVDAQYNNGDNGTDEAVTWQQGWPTISGDWGRLLVNGEAINWGAFDPGHDYSYSLVASSVKLNVYEGDGTSYVPSWYGDNQGSLHFTITTI